MLLEHCGHAFNERPVWRHNAQPMGMHHDVRGFAATGFRGANGMSCRAFKLVVMIASDTIWVAPDAK